MSAHIVIKQRARSLDKDGCGWCGTPHIHTARAYYLYRFGVVTRRGIAWDDDNQFCSKWCFADYHDEACFLDWTAINE